MLLKILLIGVLVAGGMATLKDGRLLARAGLVASCRQEPAAQSDATTQSCRSGRLEGFPNLEKKSCTSEGVKADGREYWLCLAPIVVSQAPRG